MQLPNGFTAIKDATSTGASVNLIGLLVSYDGPKPSRGTDHVLAFTLQDDFASGSVGGETSISGRIFKPASKFPKISGPGDVLIVRKAKLTDWRGRIECISDKSLTSITVFPSKMIPVPELSHAYQAGSQKLPCDSTSGAPQPTIPEQMAVIHLKHASRSSDRQLQQHAVTITSKTRTTKRDSLIKDLQLNTFADVRAQVVNMYRYGMGGQMDMKITDYTANDALFYYADPEKETGFVADRHWKGPYGYLVLNVTLYEENANWAAANLAVGEYVFIRNMRVKLSGSSKLEGALHQDKLNPSQIDIRVLRSATDIEEINKRREEYEKGRRVTMAFEKIQSKPDNPSTKASKSKRSAKRERLRAEKLAEAEELDKRIRESEAERTGLNTHSKTITVPCCSLLILHSSKRSW